MSDLTPDEITVLRYVDIRSRMTLDDNPYQRALDSLHDKGLLDLDVESFTLFLTPAGRRALEDVENG